MNRGRGILGIERKIQEDEARVDQSIGEAFVDLKKLMEKAQEMAKTAKSIATKLKDKSNKEISEDETIVLKSQLLELGVGGDMEDPVTRKASANSNAYYRALGAQIASLLNPVLEKGQGQLPLTDVYCMVNRMRGMDLISSEDLINACYTLEKQQLGCSLVQFPSGLMVLQSDHYNSEVMDQQVCDQVSTLFQDTSQGLSAHSLSQKMHISPSLARQRLLSIEGKGFLVRDESVNGLIFYPNLFSIWENLE